MKPRIPETVVAPVTFHAKKDHVVAIMQVGKSSFGLRFNSPEQILEFMYNIFQKAAITWPDNDFVKQFLDEDE